MTDHPARDPETPPPDTGRWPRARRVHRHWPGIVWALPLAAALFVGYLGIQALFTRGIPVTVTFASADGVTPGDTKVLENGVEVGEVTKVRNLRDSKRVELTLNMVRESAPALNTASRFWLIGEQPKLTDLKPVRAAIAGLTVGLAPGVGGRPARHFVGLDHAPLIPPGSKGTIYRLHASQLGSIQPGATVGYLGQPIGRVVATGMHDLDDFRMLVFIDAPFDRLIRQGALFWRGSPLRVQLTGSGLQTELAPSSVLQGSVLFDLPPEARGNPRSPRGTAFPLYNDRTSAQEGPTGPQIPYRLALAGDAGDLVSGAPVTLLGYTVGKVRSTRLVFAPGSARPFTAATIALFPARLDIAAPEGDAGAWRAATDAAVNRLLANGYRATLSQTIPLVGGHAIALRQTGGRSQLGQGPPYPLIPTSGASGDVGALVAKLNGLPLEEIGSNVRRLTANLARITGSREVDDSLRHLDGTLTQLDAITREIRPKVGPLMTNLTRTADELQATAAAARTTLDGSGANQDQSLPEAIRQLTEAARSIRSLTDYLGRHPEALLRGKAKDKP